jgi:predicted MFS family arabinose efflux permease
MLPQGITFLLGRLLGGRIVDTVGSRALIASGSALAVASYVSLMAGHSSWLQLALPTAGISFGAGLILTGPYPVVIRGASIDKTGIAIAMNVLVRNTAVVVGLALQVARRPRANGLYASDGS